MGEDYQASFFQEDEEVVAEDQEVEEEDLDG